MRVVFCVPGKQFSGLFLKSWTKLLSFCLQENIEVILSQRYSPNIYLSRNLCLGGDILKGKNQRPFDGVDYDYVMWIDSDMVFAPVHFQTLLANNVDFVCGVYRNSDGLSTTAVRDYVPSQLTRGELPHFIPMEELKNGTELIEVSYSGLGFALMKNGVIERLSYPWFNPHIISFGNIVDFTTEDVGFCWELRDRGVTTLIDPKVIVLHEKLVAI